MRQIRSRCNGIDCHDRRCLCSLHFRRLSAPQVFPANWSSLWYMLSAFAVISYTANPIYVLFAASGSWLGAFGAVTWLNRMTSKPAEHHGMRP